MIEYRKIIDEKIEVKEGLKMTNREEKFCELIADGLKPQQAHLAAGYSMKSVSTRPYTRLQNVDVKKTIQELMDKSLKTVVKNDISLAKIKVHKGGHILPDGNQIPSSLIESAKQRVYDRSSLGPVIRQNRNENINVGIIDLTPEEEAELDRKLAIPYAPTIDVKATEIQSDFTGPTGWEGLEFP